MGRYDIFDDLLEGCQIIGFDWRYLYVNHAVVRQSRKSRQELIGSTMPEAFPGIEQTPLFAAVRTCMEARVPAEMQNEFVYPDGSTGWFELRIEPVPEGACVLSIDITPRKRIRLELQQRIAQLDSLRAIDVAILGTTDLGLALKTVLEETKNRLAIDYAAIYLFDPATLLLELTASIGSRPLAAAHGASYGMANGGAANGASRGGTSNGAWHDGNGNGLPSLAARPRVLRLGEGVIGEAAFEQRAILIPDTTAAFLVEGDAVAPALAAVPLVAKGEVLGVLHIEHGTPLAADAEWVDFMGALAGQAALAIDIGNAFRKLQRTNLALNLAYDRTIEGWSRALDLRDRQTECHTMRVTETTLRLARRSGISEELLKHVRRGALLHDIGKMGIPDRILHKPGPLTEEEWRIMRMHPVYAYEMLRPIEELRPALDIPYCHHEKWDGTGYPRGLVGDEIPLAARLFAIVDVWDALHSDRPYRTGWPTERVEAHLLDESGKHFDPAVVDLFLSEMRELSAAH